MTVLAKPGDIALELVRAFPTVTFQWEGTTLVVPPDKLPEIVGFLKTAPGLDFDYLVDLSGVDYLEYFEIVYHLRSLNKNHDFVLKTRCQGREKPIVPSLVSLYKGADLQEREVFDLMGITFTGHPNLKRLFLWEGFPGHPLRRDYL